MTPRRPDVAEQTEAGVDGRALGRAAPDTPPTDLVPPPDHPAYVPAGDPDRTWRKRSAWLSAAGWDAPDDPSILDQLTVAERLDAFLRLAEWGLMASCPEVRATAKRAIMAANAMLRCETDAAGRAVSMAKILGLQTEGPGGLSAGQAVARQRRNALLRQARATRPEWRDASDRRAAALMLVAFTRYRQGAWQADQHRTTAPAGDPARALFWRILRLGVSVPTTAEGLTLTLMDQ